MKRQCLSPETLLAVAEERLAAAAAFREHAGGCRECREALVELRALQVSLADLAQADRTAARGIAWAALATRLERPRLADRLPLDVWAAWREAGVLLRPAVAGTMVATLAGLALGTWMALATQRGTSQALATEPYSVSTLVSDGSRGLAATYFGDAENESNALDGGASTTADDGTAGTGRRTAGDPNSAPDATSAAGDSEGARP